MAQEHHITVSKTARYFTLGDKYSKFEEIWFVCHGYGQLASFFIKHFQKLDNGNRLIVAPEALSRFYPEPTYQRVAATWMTREDRLNEIKDYINYLDQLSAEILRSGGTESTKIILLGFSQATATICRWVAHGKINPHHIILWAGRIPPELKLKNNREIFKNATLTMVIGTNDEYATEDIVKEEESRLIESGFPFQPIRFDGGHQMDVETLQRVSEQLSINSDQ